MQLGPDIRLSRDPAGWSKPGSEHEPPLADDRSGKVRDAPQVTRTERRTPTGRYFSERNHQVQL